MIRSAAATLVVSALSLAFAAAYGACSGDPPSGLASDSGTPDRFLYLRREAGRDDATGATTDGQVQDAGLPDGPWRPVLAAAPCPLSEAVIPPDPFPARTWTGCGTGCLVGIASPWPGSPALVGLSGGAYMQGDTYVLLSTAGQPQLVAVMRMSDGRTMAAARLDTTDYGCDFGGLGNDDPLLFSVDYVDGGGAFFGRASREPGAPIDWQSSWIVNGPSIWLYSFMFDNGHGLNSNGGTVYWLPSTSATAFTVLDNSISPVDYASGRGPLLIWNKNDGNHGWIMRFLADAGAPSHLYDEAAGIWINAARVTDDQIVWLSVSGPQALQFTYARASIQSMKYQATTSTLATASSARGAMIPATTVLDDLSAGGDYAATIGCDSNPDEIQRVCHVFVVQVSTQKVWAIPQRPGGNLFLKVLAVSPSEIVLAEQDPQPRYAWTLFKRIVRLETAHLDDIVATW